jgi:hypothetical protein
MRKGKRLAAGVVGLLLVAGVVMVSTVALAGAPTGVGQPKASDLPYKLGKIPKLTLAPRPPLTADQAKQIRKLVAGLADLDSPDFGLSATLSGENFAPVPGQQHAGMMLLTKHGLKPSETLQALVALGPDALPFLLDALDDKTPTKITIKHDFGFGGMWHGGELPLNPVNPAEQAVYKARPKKQEGFPKNVKSYTIKMGDVCFVAIGQIVGHGYQAVRYQPTACIVLNCPTHDAKLCAHVRAIWKSDDPRRKLFDSLCADYATEGATTKSNDGWSFASRYQCAAALRLLYYFDKEAAPLLADRLAKLDVGKDKDLDGYQRRYIANGVDAVDFIKAIAWSKNALIQKALVGVFKRAGDVDALLAALPAVEEKDLIRGRLESAIAALPAKEKGPYGHGYDLLVALGQKTPETAKSVFEKYLKNAGLLRCYTVCVALREVKLDGDVELLSPLLKDKRDWGYTYAVKPG